MEALALLEISPSEDDWAALQFLKGRIYLHRFRAGSPADAQAANNEGFTGTPSFLLGKTGGQLQKLELNEYTEAAPYEAAIEKLLKS